MPPWVQGQFKPLWQQWLEEWKVSGHFQGTECGSPPTVFALWAMGFTPTEIAEIHPRTPHNFITVRLNNETPLGEIQKKLENITFKWLVTGQARLEIFSSDAQTRNHHVHILSTPQAPKTRIIRDLSRLFSVNRENVDVKKGEKCEVYDKRSAYIQGEKMSLKSEAIDKDQKVLDELNIPQIYSIENI